MNTIKVFNMKHFKHNSESQTVLSELMVPSYANFGGRVHGGTILSMMDKVAYACATKHAGNYCVTASVETVDFLTPVEIGDQLSLYASVNYVGNTSLVVGIKVVSENLKQGTVSHTNKSYFTMVAIDDNKQPAQVPGLILKTYDDVRRFSEAKKRKEINKYVKQQFIDFTNDMVLDEEIPGLEGDNCKVEIES